MDATITAAWIAAGVGAVGIVGTVVTAVVGSRSTRRATEATVAAGAATTGATLAAAREDRLWDKRCAAYEEALADLLHRQTKRQHDMRQYRLDEASEQRLDRIYGSYDELGGFFETRGRLLAYGSDVVIDAYNAAVEAHTEIQNRYSRYVAMAEDNKLAAASGQHGTAHGGEETIAALQAAQAALEDAGVKDQALIDVIRDELRSKPEAATFPATVPAKRRRIWERAS